MNSNQPQHPVFIENEQQLQQVCQQWAGAPLLALDTEFIRTDTFYPIAGLVQVSDGKGCFLLDPLALEDFSPFVALLENPDIVKIIHSCGEDLEVFDCLFGVLPQPLFDTQIGAALAGMDFSMSYQRVVEALLQQHVPKGETRSNWLQRPLTASQVHYAALDVAYLPDIYRLLADKLHAQDRFQWWHEDCQAATDRFCQYSPPELYYQKVKSAWKLDPPQLAVLQQVTCWRELQARERDVPRGRIVKDRACVDMARRLPQTLEQLAGMEDMQHRNVRKDGETLLQLVRAGTEVKEQEWPAALPRPLPTQSGSLVKTLKARVESCAAQLQIPQEMLARKKDYEVLVRDQVLPDTLSGWRKAVIGEQLLKMVQ